MPERQPVVAAYTYHVGMVRRWNVRKQEGVLFTHEALPDLPGVHHNTIKCRAAENDIVYTHIHSSMQSMQGMQR